MTFDPLELYLMVEQNQKSEGICAGTFNQNMRVFTFCRHFPSESEGNNSIFLRRSFPLNNAFRVPSNNNSVVHDFLVQFHRYV